MSKTGPAIGESVIDDGIMDDIRAFLAGHDPLDANAAPCEPLRSVIDGNVVHVLRWRHRDAAQRKEG
jgi:hypothetical protein